LAIDRNIALQSWRRFPAHGVARPPPSKLQRNTSDSPTALEFGERRDGPRRAAPVIGIELVAVRRPGAGRPSDGPQACERRSGPVRRRGWSPASSRSRYSGGGGRQRRAGRGTAATARRSGLAVTEGLTRRHHLAIVVGDER